MDSDVETVTENVVQAVATAEGVDPLELPPLYDVVNPDTLNDCIESLSEGEVQFEYAGHSVRVESDGTVELADDLPWDLEQGEQTIDS